MPNYTFPNQRTVCVHRERPSSDFLGIKNENWMAAARDLGAHALKLYLYLASNADNYKLALSPAAVRQAIGMARSTFHDQFHVLVDKGYLVPAHGSTYDFFETPRPRPVTQSKSVSVDGLDFENGTSDGKAIPQTENNVLEQDIEINKINNLINTETNIFDYVPKVKEVTIPVPKAEGKKPIQKIEMPKKGEFVF